MSPSHSASARRELREPLGDLVLAHPDRRREDGPGLRPRPAAPAPRRGSEATTRRRERIG